MNQLRLTMKDWGGLAVFNWSNVEMYIGFDGYTVIHLISGKGYEVVESVEEIDRQVSMWDKTA